MEEHQGLEERERTAMKEHDLDPRETTTPRPKGPGPMCPGYESEAGPAQAVADFLRNRSDFEVDTTRERYLLTFSPGGFLKRK
jgi:hypothetical protein